MLVADGAASNTSTISFDINPRPFTFVWRTTGVNESMTLPFNASGTYNATIDWGDGSGASIVTSNTDPDATHIYATAGIIPSR